MSARAAASSIPPNTLNSTTSCQISLDRADLRENVEQAVAVQLRQEHDDA